MARRSNRQTDMRARIAAAAARIMAEDGVDDFALAKRKAARQLGAGDARAMPDNQEIELALAEYRSIYQQQELIDRLTREVIQLRQQAPEGQSAPRNLRDELPPHY